MTVDRLWYILGKRLSGEATEEELFELEGLLNQHPELYYSVQNIMDLWRLGKQVDDTEARQALKKHLQRLETVAEVLPSQGNSAISAMLPLAEPSHSPSPVKIRSFGKWVAVAASLVLASGVVFWAKRSASNAWVEPATAQLMLHQDSGLHKNRSEISTRAGSHSKIVLPDGSIVWLNAGSKIEYDRNFDHEIREVSLNGEAYFDVVKDSSRPFIVHTHKLNIRVLGTAFNVKSYLEDNLTETSLIHGSIEVTMNNKTGEKIVMKPSQKLTISGEATTLSPVKTETVNKKPKVVLDKINYLPGDKEVVETSWMNNRFVFRDKKFYELAHELERRYGIPVQFYEPGIQELSFSGNFKNETVEQVLQALQLANHFSYVIKNETIIITP